MKIVAGSSSVASDPYTTARTSLAAGGRSACSPGAVTGINLYRLIGCAGLAIACSLTNVLVVHLGLSLSLMLVIVTLSILIFIVLVMATKIVIGHEFIIYYHHEIAVLSGIALFLRLLHQPVLPYLDIFVLGLGVFLACGRIGCLLVGCCHGRPCRWGITYREHHAAAGFTPYYVGISLFPVQALESFFALAVVGFGVRMVLHGGAPGSALSWYVIAYGFGRFCFEFLRGDPERPYFFGFSEAQWTSLILMSLTVYSEFSHALPRQLWHLGVTLALVLLTVAVAIHRRFRKFPTHRLLHPRHIREVACALEYAAASPSRLAPEIRVGCTSQGIQISSATTDSSAGEIHAHYCLSRRVHPLTFDAAATLAGVICQLRHHPRHFRLIPGNNHVFHCVILRQPCAA
jgi:hypothetical protein